MSSDTARDEQEVMIRAVAILAAGMSASGGTDGVVRLTSEIISRAQAFETYIRGDGIQK